MNILNLNSKKVSAKTVREISEFVYKNRAELSNEMKMFYTDVRGIIEIQLTKPAAHRLSMSEILERAYNIEQYVLAAGAVSYEVEFVG